MLAATGATAQAAGPLAAPRVVKHFDLAAGQLPENVIAAPQGGVDVTFAAARQVARVSAGGSVRVLATLPAPPEAAKTPVLGFPLTTGLQRGADGSLYTLYATGDPATTGLWRIRPGTPPRRIAALPADGLPNGLVLDPTRRRLFIADSVNGTISRVSTSGGAVTIVSRAPTLAARGFLGVNGLRLHRGSLYATNLDRGTVLRLAVTPAGGLGTPREVARGLKGIDDFAFAGGRILAAINPDSTLVEIGADGGHRVVLRRADGLSNPTAVLVRGRRVYVTSAAYVTRKDPNLLTATLTG